MPCKGFIARCVLFTLFCSSLFNSVLGDDCQPATWRNRLAMSTYQAARPSGTVIPAYKVKASTKAGDAEPGQIVCRYYGHTEDTVNYYTCTDMADFYQISLEDFFTLNPDLKADCSNIQPNESYCVKGYVQPVVSTDGFCGPQHNNATCQLTPLPCCNSETWKCGNSTADCAPGTCWDGLCQGHTVYSVDGKCGRQNNNLLCGGKWGDCCNFDGVCGTGDDFCGNGKCQSGNCTSLIVPPPPPNNSTNWTPDGTCGPAKGYVCNVVYGNCCNKDNVCGSLPQDCSISSGCQSQYGTCNNATTTTTTTTTSASLAKLPVQTKPPMTRASLSSNATKKAP